MIEVSLIIPVYNKEKYLRKTLESIILYHNIEDYKFECILVNESSTDESKDICLEYTNKYKYFKYYEILNDGVNRPSNARNFGIMIAQGKYIMFLDADDLLYIYDFIKIAYEFLEKNPEYNIYIGNYVAGDTTNYDNHTSYYHFNYLNWFEFNNYGPNLSSCLFKSSLIKKYKFENTPNEDIIFTLKVLNDKDAKYYYNANNTIAYVYSIQSSDMVKYDRQDDLWYIECVKNLQYYPWYNYKYISTEVFKEKNQIYIQNIDYHLTDKCNLNCAHCNHFCPLVPNDIKEKSVSKIISDLSHLNKFANYFVRLTLLGGEPTLHSNLDEILNNARKIFPNNEIMLITNGTTYKQLYKWTDVIIKNHILVHISTYPLKNSEEILNEFKFRIPPELLIIDTFPKDNGFTYKLLMENYNSNDEQILHCMKRYGCIQLIDNKLYICHYAGYLHYLTNYFPNIKLQNNDAYITTNESIEKIINFLKTSIPDICRHCNDVTQYNVENNYKYLETKPWKVSNKTIDEFYEMSK